MPKPSTRSIQATRQAGLMLGKDSLYAAGSLLVGLLLVRYCISSYPMKRCAFSENLRSDLTTDILLSR
ncbi:hypothetical protein [Verrucomicrobium sp. BvORR034]|uniref:hypothetical protein n=1 Tax=Verrucomicrobium sp. BvORR034 TaxID=1396418 RepID=UPI000679B93E|nr:hypothetical protein [Verrucomicrobium sp. BvORR034]